MNSEQLFQLQHLYLKAADQLGFLRICKEVAEETGQQDYLLKEIEKHELEFKKANERILAYTMPLELMKLLN